MKITLQNLLSYVNSRHLKRIFLKKYFSYNFNISIAYNLQIWETSVSRPRNYGAGDTNELPAAGSLPHHLERKILQSGGEGNAERPWTDSRPAAERECLVSSEILFNPSVLMIPCFVPALASSTTSKTAWSSTWCATRSVKSTKWSSRKWLAKWAWRSSTKATWDATVSTKRPTCCWLFNVCTRTRSSTGSKAKRRSATATRTQSIARSSWVATRTASDPASSSTGSAFKKKF